MKSNSSRAGSPAARPPEAGAVPVTEVTHGLNNTLMIINGFSELLLGVMSECDPHRRYVEEIQRAGQHAAELTLKLLPRARQQLLGQFRRLLARAPDFLHVAAVRVALGHHAQQQLAKAVNDHEGVVQTMRHLRDWDDAGWRWVLGGASCR